MKKQMTDSFVCQGNIPLYVLATAGMRNVDENTAEKIYNVIKGQKNINGYKVKDAKTISGKYEGLYAWLAANYSNKRLGFSISTHEKPLTFTGIPLGIIEIGGASMQIAFTYNNTDVKKEDTITRKGFSVYSKSYLGGGVNEVYEKYKKNNNNLNYSEVVKELYTTNTKFLGLGKPIEIVLDSVKKKGDFNKYISSLGDDMQNEYHPKSNAMYIRYVLGELGLINNNNISENIKAYDVSWTQGAALDIVVNGCEPQSFNYNNPN